MSYKYIGHIENKHYFHLSEFSCNEKTQLFKNPNMVN